MALTKLALPLNPSRWVQGGAPFLAAVVLGVVYPVTAYVAHPLALPALLVFGALAMVTISRPEMGIAAGLVVAALNPPLAGVRPWMPAAAWTAYLLLVALWRWGTDHGQQTALPALALVTLLFFAVSVAGLAQAPATLDALWVMRSTATGLALFFVVATQIRTRQQVQWVLGGAGVGALLIGGTATWEYITAATSSVGFVTSSGEVVGRVTAGFDHPNWLGGFLVVVVPAAMAAAVLSRRGRALYVVAVVVAVMGIYASFSRAALLGLAVVPLAFLRWRHALVVLPLLVCVTLLGTPEVVRERFATLTTGGAEVAGRIDFWRTAVTIWSEQPVLGAGIGSFPDAYSKTRRPGKQFVPSTAFEAPPHAHNLFLHLLAEQGVAGLVAFLGVLAVALRHILGLQRSAHRWISVVGKAILASLLAFLVHNQFDVTLFDRTAIYFWALLGLVSALSGAADERAPTDGAGTRALA